jgi:DNA-binding NtrC family response regulator
LRELFHVLQGARAHAQRLVLDAAELPAYLRQQVVIAQMPAARTDAPVPVRTLMVHVERRIIELALRRARGQKRLAAKLLSVHVPWLYKRLHELNLIEPGEPEPSEGEA